MPLCKFTQGGLICHTIHEYDKASDKAYLEQGYHEVTLDDLKKYETLQFLYDFQTGKPIQRVVAPPALEVIKQRKIAELKVARDKAEVEPIEYQGYSFDYDEKARERINAAIIALDVQTAQTKAVASIDWTTADNADVKVTANDLRMVIASVANRSNALHIAYRVAKGKVEQATSVAEVETISLGV